MDAFFSAAKERLQHVVSLFPERLRTRGLLIGTGLFAGVLILLALNLSGLVLSQVQKRCEARGFTFSASDVDLGFAGVAFQDVVLTHKASGAQLLRAANIAVESPVWAWRRGFAGVEAIAIEEPALEISSALLAQLKEERAQGHESENRGEGSRGLPPVRLVRGKVVVSDRAGVLLKGDDLELELSSDGAFSVKARRIDLGTAPGEVVLLEGARMRGVLAGTRPQLASAAADAVTLEWAPEVKDPASDGWPAGRGRTLARLRDFRPDTGAKEASDAGASVPPLWTPDARIELSGMRVLVPESDGSRSTLLSGLDVTLAASGPEALRVTGAGKAPPSGELSWDVKAVPGEARVEGHVTLKDVSLALFAPVLPPLPFFDLESTRVHADLELAGRGLETVAVKGKLEISDLTFASEGLSRVPVGPFSLATRGEGSWTPARRELSITAGELKVGGAAVQLAGVLAWPSDGYRIDVQAQMPKTPCQVVLNAIPPGLLDELASIQFEGTIAGKLDVHVASSDLDATKVDFDIADACKFVSRPPLLDLQRFEQPFLHTALEPDGTVSELETGPGTPAWTPIEMVSPFMVQAVIAHEDGRFFSHRGFAEPEIGVALARNLKARAFKFGASTITMQLVKNVFLHRDKLLARKVQEALITWWLEQQWDKKRILQLYLNVIEYGPQIYGLRNAAWHYFGTLPIYLTPAQSAFLASVLPSPKVFYEHYVKGQLSPSMKSRLATFLKHMHARQRIDDEALAFGLEELEHFTFYDPEKPPPPPPQIRGTAQPPPFGLARPAFESWEFVDIPEEDGSFGGP